MVGGGNRKDESVVLNSTNVFAALGTLRKKKKSDKEQGSSKSKSSSKKKQDKDSETQVFWAPTPLTVKSWADVDDEDDDDYYATTAPPQAGWGGGAADPEPTAKESTTPVESSFWVTCGFQESESEEGLDEVDDDNEEEHDHEPEVPVEKEPVVKKLAEVSLAPKDPERQLSKKELKKKELAELDAVLAELGYPKSEASGQDDSRGDAQEKKLENLNGEAEKKENAPGESKSAKKKKKKDKSLKEAKEQQDQPNGTDATNGADESAGTDKAAEDTSVVDVKEKMKKVASMKKKKSSKEMDAAARAAASEAAARNAKLAAAKKKEKNHYNQQPVRDLHFSHLDIPITIDRIFSVMPASSIPVSTNHSLYLSNIDDMIGARVFTPTVYFYRSNNFGSPRKPIMEILLDALASVLVPYYPFSGRLRETQNGKLEVFFGEDQGVLMVQAHSEMALANLGDFTVPNPAWLPLVYRFPNEGQYQIIDMPLLIAQVTYFSCGGFSLGLRTCHCLSDGLGAMQFLNAWSSTAKAGVLVTNPNPCWDREIFRPREPPLVKYPHVEFMRIEDGSDLTMKLWQNKPVQKCYRISREFQARLKNLARAHDDSTCTTTFDAMAAHVWRSWVKALDVKPLDCNLRLTFSVNARQKLKNPPLKSGFYGNVMCVACATSTVSELVNGCLAETRRLVHDARLGISEEYLRSTIDYFEVDRPKRLEFGGKLTITQWTRFSIYESADFGWGRPIYAGPLDLTPTPQVCVFLPEGEGGSDGTMLVCICLPELATKTFRKFLCLMDLDDQVGQ
ncbi:unnamed protein product [Camellia sinensis]